MRENITVLLVDDDIDDRKLFSEALTQVDKAINLVVAASGQEALLYLKKVSKPPDYIFLDLRMPGLSGQQCLVEIKKDPRLISVPVIIYTTSREVSDSIRLQKLGAVHFMSKPVSPDEVYYMVSFVLNEKWN
jgi:CheY-like chemotaxis protein